MQVRYQPVAVMAIAIAGLVLPQQRAFAQAEPRFEVSQSIGKRTRVSETPQKITFQTALVGDIMAFAYELPLDRIERRPQWMYDERYDVAVTTAGPASLPEQRRMLRELLEKRFGLAVHRVTNPSPVYFLVAGAKVNLTPTSQSDATGLPEFRMVTWMAENGTPGRLLAGEHVSMSDLAAWLYPQLQLPVLDKTGIPGWFDIEIAGMTIRGGSEGTIRAVHNALGLDLELHHGTAETLIIDQVERPKAN